MTTNEYGKRGPPIGIIHLDKNDQKKEEVKEKTISYATLYIYQHLSEIAEDNHLVCSTDQSDLATMNMTLCTQAIPSYISIPEFLNFVAPADPFISHYRVIR